MSIDVNCTAWRGFKTGEWRHVVNVRNFIQKNYTPYAGGDGFLEGTTEKTKKVWEKAHGLILEEVKRALWTWIPQWCPASTTLLPAILIKTMK